MENAGHILILILILKPQDTFSHSVPEVQPMPKEADAGHSQWTRETTLLQVGSLLYFFSYFPRFLFLFLLSCISLSFFQALLWAEVHANGKWRVCKPRHLILLHLFWKDSCLYLILDTPPDRKLILFDLLSFPGGRYPWQNGDASAANPGHLHCGQ